MGAAASGRMFVAPLVADLNDAKQLLAAKGFDEGTSVSLWGPGIDGLLQGISHHDCTIRLSLRSGHPWEGLAGLGEAPIRPLVEGISSQLRPQLRAGSAHLARVGGEIQVIVNWTAQEDPPVTSLAIRLVACALAVVRRGGVPAPAVAPTGSRTDSLADALTRRRGA